MIDETTLLFCLLLGLLLGVTAQAQSGRKFALVVGIDNYANNQLYGSVHSAGKFQELLLANGYCEDNITLLLNGQATRQEILRQLKVYLQNKVKPGDLFVFYFSGHGMFFPDVHSLFRDEQFPVEYPNGTSYNDSALV